MATVQIDFLTSAGETPSETWDILLYNGTLGNEVLYETILANDPRKTIVADTVDFMRITGIDVTDGVNYNFSAKARTDLGFESLAFSPITAINIPSLGLETPTNIAVSEDPVTHEVTVTWTDPTVLGDGIRVKRREAGNLAWTDLADVGNGVQTYLDTTSQQNLVYEYLVVNYNATEESTEEEFGVNKVAITMSTFEPNLFLNGAVGFADRLEPSTSYSLTGEWHLEIEMQDGIEESGYLPVFKGSNLIVMASTSNQQFQVVIGADINVFTTQWIDILDRNIVRIYRTDVGGGNYEVYLQLNGGTPELCGTTNLDSSLQDINDNSAREGTMRVIALDIDGHVFDFAEGSGTTTTSTDLAVTLNIVTSQSPNQPYIDDNVWQTTIPLPSGSIEVINQGVGGETTAQIEARYATWSALGQQATAYNSGTNDTFNTGGMDSSKTFAERRAEFIAKIESMANNAIALGQDFYIINLPPFITSELKLEKDYTPYYTTTEIADMQTEVIDVVNSDLQTVCTNTGAIYVDAHAKYVANGDPKTTIDSYTRNPLNAGGEQDWVHPTPTGYDLGWAQAVYDAMVANFGGIASNITYTKVVCVGDSITEGSTAGASNTYPVKLQQKLNS